MDIQTLLKSKGGDVITDRTAKHLQKHAGELSGLVKVSYEEARAALPADASSDAVAVRGALILLRKIAHLPKRAAVAPVAENQPADAPTE